jgi:hypothetical protein
LGENTLGEILKTPPSLQVGGLEKGERKNSRRRHHGRGGEVRKGEK